MRFLRYPGEPRRLPEPTPSEVFVQEHFGEAIAFVQTEWEAFNAELAGTARVSFSLTQRVAAFMAAPLAAKLDARFPDIAALGAEADALTEMHGNIRALFKLIVGEAIIAAGKDSRGNVRRALPD